MPLGGGGNLKELSLKKPNTACRYHIQHQHSETLFYAALGKLLQPVSRSDRAGVTQEP